MPTWLRVVLILLICGILLAATAALLLIGIEIGAYAGFSSRSLRDPGVEAILFGYIVVLAGGAFGVYKLAKGFRSPVLAHPYPGGAGSIPSDYPPSVEPVAADPEKVMHLCIALAAKVVVGALYTLFLLLPKHTLGHALGVENARAFSWHGAVFQLISFLAYEGPYGIILLTMARKVERFSLAVALTLPVAEVLSSAHYLLAIGRFYQTVQMPVLVFTAGILALEVIIFVLALRLREQLGKDAAGLLVSTAVLSLVYVVLSPYALSLASRILLSRILSPQLTALSAHSHPTRHI